MRVSLKLVDLPAIEKRGHVVVQYFFTEMPGKPFGLDSFVPGGLLYGEWNKSLQGILFGFYVQCRFLSELSAEVTGSGDCVC